jgi:hypothetical protein
MGTSDNLHDDPEKENEKLSDEKRERDERKKRRIEEKKQKKKAAEDKDRFIRETLKIDHKNNLRVYSRRVGVTLLLALFFGMVAGVTFFVANHFISIPYLDDNGKGMETPTVSTSETPAAERSQTETVSNAIMPEDLTTLQGYEDVSKKLAGIGNSFNDSITSFTVNSADDTGVNYPDSLVPGLIFDEDDEHYYIVASGADGKYSKSSMQVGDDFSVAVWTLASVFFAGFLLFPRHWTAWMAFVWAVPMSLGVLLSFNRLWGSQNYRLGLGISFTLALFAAVYLEVSLDLASWDMWFLLLIAVPMIIGEVFADRLHHA